MSRLARAACVGLMTLLACRGEPAPPQDVGRALATALTAGVTQAAHAQAPWPCGRADQGVATARTFEIDGTRWQVDGDRAFTAPANATRPTRALVLGAWPGSERDDAELWPSLNALVAKHAIDVVIALGDWSPANGPARARLAGLAALGPAVVLVPGSREVAADLRAAIAAGPAHVLDGMRVRRLDLGRVRFELLPGEVAPSRLAAGTAGCAAPLTELAARAAPTDPDPPTTVLFTTVPPDGTAGRWGVDAGEFALAPTFAAVIHPQVGPPAQLQRVTRMAAGGQVGVPPTEPGPRLGPTGELEEAGALIVQVADGHVDVQVAPLRAR